jgi:hypothetical protein
MLNYECEEDFKDVDITHNFLTEEQLYSFYPSQGATTTSNAAIMNPINTKPAFRGSLLHNGGYNKAV